MFSYTHRNHFEFGYNGRPFESRSCGDDRFTVAYGRCQRPPGDFRAECVRAAHLVSESTDLPIHVLFSGGSESEMVVRSFVEAGLPFRVSVLRYQGGLNEHDICYALDYCREVGIDPDIVDLDLLKFWETELFDYAELSHSVSPQFCPTMWLCDQIDGLPVIGGGECFLAAADYDEGGGSRPVRLGDPRWFLWEREKVASWYRFLMIRNRPGLGGFFQYTPELMWAFLVDGWTQRLVRGQIAGEVENEATKLRVYQRYFPLRVRTKYTGFEKVMDRDRLYRRELIRRHGAWNQIAKTEYETLLDALRFDEEEVQE